MEKRVIFILIFCLAILSVYGESVHVDKNYVYTVSEVNDSTTSTKGYVYEERDKEESSLDPGIYILTEKDLRISSEKIKRDKIFDPSFKPVQLIAPLSLIAVGTAGYYWKGFHKLNEKVRDGMTHIRGDHYLHFDDYLQYAPVVGYLGLGFWKGGRKLDWRERVATGVTAYLAMTAITNIGKYTFKEKRPDSKARNSFPSGHTATAFTGAELVREEFGWGIGSVAYVVSTGVAFMRLYNGRHWLNDVIAGAGIGILSARIGYWMLPHYRKWFHWDKKKTDTVCVAMPSYSEGNIGLNFMCVF